MRIGISCPPCILILFLGTLYSAAVGMPGVENGQTNNITPVFVDTPPLIDGDISDPVWGDPVVDSDFKTYNPTHGDVFPQKTMVFMAFDAKNIYVAFKCFDTEAGKIKTSISRRDSIFSDDWVGLSLDAMGTKQMSYDLFVNPSGIQGDILNSSVSGEDLAPDIVWKSAGRITEEGYQVEIKVPLRSIRFKSGKDIRMGILFWRRISRLGLSGSWPEIKPGEGLFNIHAAVVFNKLKAPLNLELLPSLAAGNSASRLSPSEWGEADTFSDIGIGLKYGLTSSVTADLTINPDFSQVESDIYQVEVNRRYPIYYSEKRPFFMEGVDIFNFFTISHGFFPAPVHTRRIVDPRWGAKLTGTVGRTAFGVLSAGDRSPGLPWGDGTNPYENKNATFSIARAKHSLGGENYIGALFTSREFSGQFNRVGGFDFSFRFWKNHQIKMSLLQSSTRTNGGKAVWGGDYNMEYGYYTRSLGVAAAFEYIGKDFDMESGFLRRTGVTGGWIWIGPNFYPDPEKVSWLRLISPQFTFAFQHDLETKMDDTFARLTSIVRTTKQGFLMLSLVRETESWKGMIFEQFSGEISAEIQLTKWLSLGMGFNVGDTIYYPADPPIKASGVSGGFGFTLQPNANLRQTVNYERMDYNHAGVDLYAVDVLYSRTTYQFNKYFFLRAIVQYNSYQKRILTDLLASFTFIPGTVLHLGYGLLHNRQDWRDNRWIFGQGDWLYTDRSFFFKASYLWRF